MDMYPQYKSPLGYTNGDNKIDAYGVDHSGFSTRDELEYQFARQNKENQLIQNYNNQGITKNYPQYGTNFWGSSPDNNYGFGTSKIHNNIENMQNQSNLGNSNNTQWGMNNEQPNNINSGYGQTNTQPQTYNIFGNNNALQNTPNLAQGLNLGASAALYPQQNSFNTYSQPYQLAQNSLPNTASDVEKLRQQTIQNVSKGITFDEGIVPYVYLDTMCNKTVGKGKNVNKWDIFRQGNYITSDGTPANETEKLNCFNKFEQKTHELCDGKPVIDGKKINYKYSFFKDVCDLKISPQEMERLKDEHIEDDLKRLERHVDNLYSYPPEIVNEIENRLYNIGWGNFKKLDVLPILNDHHLTLEKKKKLLETKLYQGKISPKRLQDSQKRLQGN